MSVSFSNFFSAPAWEETIQKVITPILSDPKSRLTVGIIASASFTVMIVKASKVVQNLAKIAVKKMPIERDSQEKIVALSFAITALFLSTVHVLLVREIYIHHLDRFIK